MKILAIQSRMGIGDTIIFLPLNPVVLIALEAKASLVPDPLMVEMAGGAAVL